MLGSWHEATLDQGPPSWHARESADSKLLEQLGARQTDASAELDNRRQQCR